MSREARGVEAIVEAIGFRGADVPHPVDLLTIEMVADSALLPGSTVESACGGVHELRRQVLLAAMDRLQSPTGPAAWTALRSIIANPDLDVALTPLSIAQAEELSRDPAFPLYLSGFERLDDPAVAAKVCALTDALFDRVWPFLYAALTALKVPLPEPLCPVGRFAVLSGLLSDAYARLLGHQAAGADEVSHLLSSATTRTLLDGPSPDDPLFEQLFSSPAAPPNPTTTRSAIQAVEAGAKLLLDGSIPFASALTVAEVRSRASLSNAAFYRHFTSMAALDHLLLTSVGRAFAEGFRDEFFDTVLDEVSNGDRRAGDALAMFLHRVKDHSREHVAHGRPGRELTPWLGSRTAQPLIAEAYRDAFDNRAAFYDRFNTLAGARYKPGFAAHHQAIALNAGSVISELLIRQAPDTEAAMAIVDGPTMHLLDAMIE